MESKPPARLLKAPEVISRTGLSRITIWRKARLGEFPAPRQTVGRRVAWLEADVEAWINGRRTWDRLPAELREPVGA